MRGIFRGSTWEHNFPFAFLYTQKKKEAPAEILGAQHVVSLLFLNCLDLRTLDPLEPARAKQVFSFSAPRHKRFCF